MKKYLYNYFFLHLKKLDVLIKCLSVVFHWITAHQLCFKISVCRSRYREPTCMEINKSIALETHPPMWECYRLVAQGRDKAPVLHSSTRGKRHLPNRYKDTKERINHYKHPRAGKGSELYSPQCKISVTHSYYIHYKIYHYRNTIYPSQISTWTNLGFYFLILWQEAQIWALCSSYCLM